MVNVYIISGGRPVAGELIRILVNHPDVEIAGVCDPEFSGRKISSVHHGLIGETLPEFTDKLPENIDGVVFVCDSSEFPHSADWLKDNKVIDLTHDFSEWKNDYVYGLPEIFRKPLVRGAKKAIIPTTIASILLISLYPLATNLLLCGDVNVEVEAPAWLDSEALIKEISCESGRILSAVQNSWTGKVAINVRDNASERGMRIRLDVPCTVLLEDVRRIYEEMYDDHNFTFVTDMPSELKEVIGTDKCLVSLTRESAGCIHIDSVADARMRGGAAEAVHVMNLLLGLHERVGLTLKVSQFQ